MQAENLTVYYRLGLGRLNEKTVRGLALRPNYKDFYQEPEYKEAKAIAALADPCDYSCQKLIPQLGALGTPKQPWNWQVSFGRQSVLATTTGTAPPQASGSGNAGVSHPEAAAGKGFGVRK